MLLLIAPILTQTLELNVLFITTLKNNTIFVKKAIMKAKYIRVSTQEQNTMRQEQNSADFDKVYIEKESGSIPFLKRKEGQKLFRDIDALGIKYIEIQSVDRLGRDISDILNIIKLFNEKEVNLHVADIGINSLINDKPNDTFKLIISVLGNVAEMERNNMLERQKNGIERRKAQGLYKGREKGSIISDEEILSKYKSLVNELNRNPNESVRRLAKLGECSTTTVSKIQKILIKQKTIVPRNKNEEKILAFMDKRESDG